MVIIGSAAFLKTCFLIILNFDTPLALAVRI